MWICNKFYLDNSWRARKQYYTLSLILLICGFSSLHETLKLLFRGKFPLRWEFTTYKGMKTPIFEYSIVSQSKYLNMSTLCKNSRGTEVCLRWLECHNALAVDLNACRKRETFQDKVIRITWGMFINDLPDSIYITLLQSQISTVHSVNQVNNKTKIQIKLTYFVR